MENQVLQRVLTQGLNALRHDDLAGVFTSGIVDVLFPFMDTAIPEIDVIKNLRLTLAKFIEHLADPRVHTVARLYYLDGLKDFETASQAECSAASMYRYKNQAIADLTALIEYSIQHHNKATTRQELTPIRDPSEVILERDFKLNRAEIEFAKKLLLPEALEMTESQMVKAWFWSIHSIESVRRSLYRKLQVNTRAAAISKLSGLKAQDST